MRKASMRAEEENLACLPPRLKGATRGSLKASLTALRVRTLPPRHPVRCRLVWWGDSEPREVTLSNWEEEEEGEARVDYRVVSSPQAFERYLSDAGKLFLQLLDGFKEEKELGFGAVWQLSEVAGMEGAKTDEVAVVDANGEKIGVVTTRMEYFPHEEVEPQERRAAFRTSKSDAAINEGSRNSEFLSGSVPTSPAKAKILSKGLRRKEEEKRKKRVVVTIPKAAKEEEDDGYLEDDDSPDDRPAGESSTSFFWQNQHHSISEDFDGNVDGLRKILIRSREKLAAAEDHRMRRRQLPFAQQTAEHQTRHFRQDGPEAGHHQEQQKQQEGHHHQRREDQFQSLPHWNLSTSRLRFLSSVNQVVLTVQRLKLTSETAKAVTSSASTKKSRPPSKTRNLSSLSSSSASRKTRLATEERVSYFVSYVMPPATLATSHCSRKTSEGDDGSSLIVDFDQRSVHPAVFRPALLDSWWTGSLTLRVLTRHFGQRDSTLIGEARIALKHLLMSEKNSAGEELRLPVFAGQKFQSDWELESEIVGDVIISFQLCRIQRSSSTSAAGVARKVVSPQRPVRDGDPEEEGEVLGPPPRVEIDRSGVGQNDQVVTLRSKNPVERRLEDSGGEDEVCSIGNEYDSVPASEDGEGGGRRRPLFCMLRVSRGRNFALRDGGSNPSSLFVACRLLSAKEMVKSEVCWNTTNPAFNLRHCVPVKLGLGATAFPGRCKDNFLVVEVWNFKDDKKAKKEGGSGKRGHEIVGVCMLPLQQLYLTFRDPSRASVAMFSDLPCLVCANDWLPVAHLVTGAEQGQLQVTLAVGTEEQLRQLIPRTVATPVPARSPNPVPELGETESEHLYDTVGEEEEEDGEEKEETEETQVKQVELPETADVPDRLQLLGEVESLSTSASRPPQPSHFRARVKVEEARRLPRVFDPVRREKVAPSTFVTFTSASQSGVRSTVTSPLATGTANPRWNFESAVDVGSESLVDPRRHFILKLWHHHHHSDDDGDGEDDTPDLETDHVIGFAAVDLAPLKAAGFAAVCGWYNIMDFVGRCRGQIKVSITPEEDLRSLPVADFSLLRRDSEVNNQQPASHKTSSTGTAAASSSSSKSGFLVAASYDHFPSHVVQHTEQFVSTTPSFNREAEDGGGCGKLRVVAASPSWNPPLCSNHPEESSTRSFLRCKLTELDDATRKLKSKLSEERESLLHGQRSGVRPRNGAFESSEPLRGLSLEDLQGSIESQLQALRGSIGMAAAASSSSSHVITRPAPPPPRKQPRTPPPSRSPSPTTVSEEIMNVLAEDVGDNGGDDGGGNGDNLGICRGTLEDLGLIDWERVTVRGGDDDGDPASRVGPEGGNPTEERKSSSARRRRGGGGGAAS